MKGLRLFLPPFAPDDAGAASVLFPLGGLVVIVDAGGCAGNICGFDEPRARDDGPRSVVVSAALRDMDAILGRDDHLVAKIARAVQSFRTSGRSFPFIALIGTPVPAIIGTDYRALCRLTEQATGVPTIAVATDGTHLYDVGASAAYLALLRRFANLPATASRIARGTLGVLGATPMDLADTTAVRLRARLKAQGWQHLRCYGLDHRLSQYAAAAENEENLVIAPAGLAAAQWLEKTFGTPYRIGFPLIEEDLAASLADSALPAQAQRILIVHQQCKANALRRSLARRYPHAAITCATYFTRCGAYSQPQDIQLREEDDLPRCALEGHYDLIIADAIYRRALPAYRGAFFDLPHFAASGRLAPADAQ